MRRGAEYGTGRSRVAAPPRHGFTLIEIVIATVIFLLLGGIVFQMFSKGSKAGAKATWRSQVTGRSRSALRQIKAAMNASSYPTFVSLFDFREKSQGYEFQLQSGTTSSIGSGMTTFVFDTDGQEVARFYRCHPIDQTPHNPLGTLSGTITEHVLRLEDSSMYPGQRLDLMMDTRESPIETASLDPVGYGNVTSLLLATEIESMEVSVATSAVTSDSTVLTVRLISRDPVDGFMRVVEESRAGVNVEVLTGS